MKFYSKLLAICVFRSNAWGTSAFIVQTSKAQSVELRSSNYMTDVDVNARPDDNKPRMATPASLVSVPVYQQSAGGPFSWEGTNPIIVQGGSLRTFTAEDVDMVQILMSTDGRPLNTNMELWHGPDYTPTTMGIYTEDGLLRPVQALLKTPGFQNTIACYNTGNIEFPLNACVEGDDGSVYELAEGLAASRQPRLVQGGAVFTVPFAPEVESVQVLMKTDGRHLVARVELLQGPNNIKQTFDFYSSDGKKRYFYAIIETPGAGNVIRIHNKYTIEYPLFAIAEPYRVRE